MRAAALMTGPDTLLDHLAPICAQLRAPCILTDPAHFQIAATFYPQVTWNLMDPLDVDLAYLANSYDALIGCGKFWAIEMGPLFELFFQKRMRFVFCPHGHSDKESMAKGKVKQDIVLAYGKSMQRDHVEYNHMIIIGNYRHMFYRMHKKFYDDLAYKYIFSRLERGKKTVFYAPTWFGQDRLEEFIMGCHRLIQELSPCYNVVIKLHPFLEDRFSGSMQAFKGHYRKNKCVFFIERFPAIYPLISGCDCYIGDASSIGYDALAMDMPLFFLDEDKCKTRLHACGFCLPKEGSWSEFIDKHLIYGEKKKEKEALMEDVFPLHIKGEKDNTTLELADLLLAALQVE